MKELLILYITFMKIGLMTVGGGYAVLPMLEKEIADKKHWTNQEELTDYFAIGQCTPGLIAVNVATFIGNKRKGISGGIAATLGFATPSIIIILCLASLLSNFSDMPAVKHAFAGIRVAVAILIIHSVIKMWKSSVVDVATLAIFLAVALISSFSNISPIIPITISALLGIVINTVIKKRLPVSESDDKSSENTDTDNKGN